MKRTPEQRLLALAEISGEGFHTALRKAGSSTHASKAWIAIADMSDEEWGYIVEFATQVSKRRIRRLLREVKRAAADRAVRALYSPSATATWRDAKEAIRRAIMEGK